jgi:hypothetical protein
MQDLPSPTTLSAGNLAQIPMSANDTAAGGVQAPVMIDPVAQQQAAYKLQENQTRAQSQQIDLQEKQAIKADQDTFAKYLKEGGNLSTPEGVGRAVEDLKTKVSPTTYQQLIKASHNSEKDALERVTAMAAEAPDKLKQGRQTGEEVLRYMSTASDAYDAAIKSGNPDDAMSQYQSTKQAGMVSLSQMKNSAGKPLLDPAVLKAYGDMSPDQLRSAIATSEFHLKQMSDAAKISEINAKAAREEATADSLTSGGAKGVLYANMVAQFGIDSPQAKQALANLSAANKDPGVPEGSVTQQERSLAVNQWIQNPSSLRGMDKTYQRNVIKWASDLGITPDDVTSGKASQKFILASAGASGRRAGNMASVEATMPGLIEDALAASEKLGRTPFVPFNKLLQMGEAAMSSPELKDLQLANQAVSSEYQQVISRGGSNVTALKEAMMLLQTADSKETYKVALNRVSKEVARNVEGAKKVEEKFTNSIKEKLTPTSKEATPKEKAQEDIRQIVARLNEQLADTKPGSPSYTRIQSDITEASKELGTPVKQTVPKKQNALPAKNSKGWGLQQDANGNRAYVGPKGEIEEVAK